MKKHYYQLLKIESSTSAIDSPLLTKKRFKSNDSNSQYHAEILLSHENQFISNDVQVTDINVAAGSEQITSARNQ